MNYPTFNGSNFTWKGNKGSTSLERLGLTEFPKDGFNILSPRTGEIRLFTIDNDKMVEMEFYDGEAVAYRHVGFWVEVWT